MTDTSNAGIIIVLCTAPHDMSEALAQGLVRDKYAVCVNIAGVSSRYLWQGEMVCDAEDLLVIKTTKTCLEGLVRFIREHHPYEIPEIIALPVIGGYGVYLDWVGELTAP